ncbi:thiamine-phosphate kinase [Desulfogranum marinum]|uniref:thiamine-phosphate kinase n=1 Tax=Desulfogranum marinum TaxID=453220 RepID=UPI001964DDC9|nr:thiamine-phosphate kinase [Desulfogranum marinum]MBM9513900.1 thiamine-phosphate kinase [Desulfogranum marinum]
MKERDIIQHITNLAPSKGEGVVQGIGDDCAVIEKDDNTVWLLTMDTLVETVHFDRKWHPPELLGRKSISVNVSDVAAMGGKPLFVLLSASLPQSFDQKWFSAFSEGIAQGCRDYGCILIGGDTVCSPEGYSFTVTVIGETAKENVLYRSSASPGDEIWVSGWLGHAAAGLEIFSRGIDSNAQEFEPLLNAHLNPEARTQLGLELGRCGLVSSMMDLSDGMATDLAHLCQRSKVKGEIYADRLPLSALLVRATDILGLSPTMLALNGGEDYELLFTAPPGAAFTVEQIGQACGLDLYRVGHICEGSGVVLLTPDDQNNIREQRIAYGGFDHFGADKKRHGNTK